MKYTIEMGSGAIIYLPSFIKIGSGIQKLRGDIETHRQDGDSISLLFYFSSLFLLFFYLSICKYRCHVLQTMTATIDRPVPSSERAPHIDKTANI
jgi:hypothetical protein